MLAQRALASGARSVDVIEGDSPLMRSFASAFASRGGTMAAGYPMLSASTSARSADRLAPHAEPGRADAVLLAVNGDRAALMKPFLGGSPGVCERLVFERPSPAVARDLDDVRVVEIPWLSRRMHREFTGLPRRDFDSTALARLLRARARCVPRRRVVQNWTAVRASSST